MFNNILNTPHDAVHDFLLTINPLNMQRLFQKVVLKKISLNKINDRISNFDYGYSELTSKPSKIKTQHLVPGSNIHQNASQMFLLAFIISFIITDAIDEETEPFLQNYLQLLEIISIILGTSVSENSLEYLEDILEDHLESYKDLYRDDEEQVDINLLPKHHYATHFVRHTRRFGPLITFWCMRMEAKHQYFKRIVQAMRNFKNLPFTLSERHQLYQTWILLSTPIKKTFYGPMKLTPIDQLDFWSNVS